MVANILPSDHTQPPIPLTLRIGIKDQILTFSKHAHVTYQIKVNLVRSNIVATILPA